jgi:hypothetical protein
MLVACSKCGGRAAVSRDELIADHGARYPMLHLLRLIAAPGCSKIGASRDRCGAYYVEPIEEARSVAWPTSGGLDVLFRNASQLRRLRGHAVHCRTVIAVVDYPRNAS